ncbi:MAG TPA: hypothetical protein VGS20_07985 [Candidatus Acidoferrales bacterium]|nr:hypothetical protein [Candidatus Acidoferrales bacterium]
MPWLLAISRDTELAEGLRRVLLRAREGYQLWAEEDIERARRRLGGCSSLPAAIVLDELFLRGESLGGVAEELCPIAPLIVIARPDRQARLAGLVAAGKADFVSREDNYLPLALALAERTLRWEKGANEQAHLAQQELPLAAPDPDGLAQQALRLIDSLLDHLDVALAGRCQLPPRLAKRLDRAADIAFELKRDLRCLAGQPEPEPESESAPQR